MSEKSGIVVKNKITYLWLLSIPVGIIKIIYDVNQDLMGASSNVTQFIYNTFISIIIILIGIYLFIKLNSYSAWLNPNHPKK